jgi:[ribosomal protein S5]-alanine N-acetyltransferase
MHRMLLDLPARFETPRLTLRPYRPGDGAWYYHVSLRNRAHLLRYEAENSLMRITSPEDAEAVVRDFAAHWMTRSMFMLAALDKENGEFMGQVYIGVVNWEVPEFEIGYIADAAHEAQGYISEAVREALGFVFNHLQAGRLRLECDDSNLRSQHVAERCGFVLEGHIRRNKRAPDGSLTGTMHYGMLREEYFEKFPES